MWDAYIAFGYRSMLNCSRVVDIFNLIIEEYNEVDNHYNATFVLMLEIAFLDDISLICTRKLYDF